VALYRIDTTFFEVVNLADPDVKTLPTAGEDGGGADADDGAPNRWAPRSSAASVGPDATVIRIRALTRPEVDALPLAGDPLFLGACVDLGTHEGDKAVVASLPWQYARTLGALIFEASTRPLDRAK